jgi:hypothetical protein
MHSDDDFAKMVERELDVLCSHRELASATKLQRLLRYLVSRKLQDTRCNISALAIFRDVYGVAFPINTNEQPRVRVAVSRLRQTLQRIYRDRPKTAVRILIPSGTYGPKVSVWGMDPLSHIRGAPKLPITLCIQASSHVGASDSGIANLVSAHLSRILLHLPDFEAVRDPNIADYCLYLVETTDDFGTVLEATLQCRGGGEILWLDTVDCPGALAEPDSIAAIIASRTFDPFTGCLWLHLSQRLSGWQAEGGLRLLLLYYALIRTHNGALIEPILKTLQDNVVEELGLARIDAMRADIARVSYSHGFRAANDMPKLDVLKLSDSAYQSKPSDQICALSAAMSHFVLGDPATGAGLLRDAAASEDCLPSLETDAAVVAALSGDWDYGLPILQTKAEGSERLPYYAMIPSALFHLHEGKIDHAWATISRTRESGSFWPKAVRSAVLQRAGQPEAARAAVKSLTSTHQTFPSTGRQSIGCFLKDQDVARTLIGALAESGLDLAP